MVADGDQSAADVRRPALPASGVASCHRRLGRF